MDMRLLLGRHRLSRTRTQVPKMGMRRRMATLSLWGGSLSQKHIATSRAEDMADVRRLLGRTHRARPSLAARPAHPRSLKVEGIRRRVAMDGEMDAR